MGDEILNSYKFLAHHFRNAPPDHFIEFRLISPTRSSQLFIAVKDLESQWPKLEASLRKANANGANVYFGVNPRTDKVGDAKHVPTVDCFWIDIDFKGELVKKNSEVLKGFNLQPSVLIDSGAGWHFYWYLTEAIPYAQAEPILKTLIRALGGDPPCFDAPRIMRLPGFQNMKYAHKPPCRVAKYNHAQEFNPGDFEPLETVAPGEYPPEKEPGKAATAPARKFTPSKLTTEIYGNGHGFAYSMAKAASIWWKEGIRHHFAVGLAGLLRKDDIREDGALLIIQKICELSNDQELEDRLTAVRTTYAANLHSIKSSEAIKEILKEEDAKKFFKEYNRIYAQLPPPPVIRRKLPEFPLYDCTPPGSIFDKYVHYASERTDAPIQYHAASIITVAASILGNKVWIPDWFGKPKLFANLYTLLVGPSSRFRKSTSISIGKRIGEQGKLQVYPNNATVERLYAKMAPEEDEVKYEPSVKGGPPKKIVESWKGSPAGIIYHHEYSSWLSASAKSYMQEARSFFMDLYDGTMDKESGSRETKTSGRYYITDPAISMLCGVTPTSIKDFVTTRDAKDGFLPRFLVIMYPPDHRNRFGLPRRIQEDIDTVSEFASLFERMKNLEGPIDVALECEPIFVDFQKYTNEKTREIEGSPLAALDGFYTRLVTMSVKIAMVYACSRGQQIITAEDLQFGVNLCRYSAATLENFFGDIKPDEQNREVKNADHLLKTAQAISDREKTSLIPHRKLMQNSNLDAEGFKKAAETLKQRGSLWPIDKPGGRGTVYRLNMVEE